VKNSTLGIVYGLTAASIWGVMYVVSKIMLDIIPPFVLVTLRLILGSLTLGLLIALRRLPNVSPRKFWQVFGVGIVGYGVSLGLQFIGTQLSTAANASLVTSATPAFILFFAWIVLNERITSSRLIALLVSSVGVVAVIDPRGVRLNGPGLWGNIALVGAALTWALYSVLIRHVTRDLDVLSVSFVAFLGGLTIAIPAAAWEVHTRSVGPIGLGAVLGVLFLGIVSTGLAMLLWNAAFALLDAGVASLTFFAQPLVGTLLAWLVLREQITPLFLVGGVLIALGLLLASRPAGT
jgi:drug/metabolite transporter (DMT)-like permease